MHSEHLHHHHAYLPRSLRFVQPADVWRSLWLKRVNHLPTYQMGKVPIFGLGIAWPDLNRVLTGREHRKDGKKRVQRSDESLA